ncbi:MAG: hypothetical protein ACREHD_23180, partial [Pirellulales bacterium]
IQNVVGRDMWLKLMKGIHLCLPRNPPNVDRPKDITQRNELNIERVTCVYKEDLATWYADVKSFDVPLEQLIGGAGPAGAPGTAAPGTAAPNTAAPNTAAPNTAVPNTNAAAPNAADAAPNAAAPNAAAPAATPAEPPKGPGWVFELKGYHYHNPQGRDFGQTFVARTLLKNLRLEEVAIPKEEQWPGGPTMFPLKKLGIGHSVLITEKSVEWNYKLEVDDPEEDAEKPGEKEKKNQAPRAGMPANGPMGQPGAAAAQAKKKWIDAPRYEFIVQFCWQVPSPDTMVELAAIYPGSADPANAAPAPGSEEQKGNGVPGGATGIPRDAANLNEDNAAEAPPADEGDNAAGPQPNAGTAPAANAPGTTGDGK